MSKLLPDETWEPERKTFSERVILRRSRYASSVEARVRELELRLTEELARAEQSEKELRSQLDEVRRVRPSFAFVHQMNCRIGELVPGDSRPRPPRFDIDQKMLGRSIARAHGVKVPDVLARWDSISDIDLSGLPDRFVLKSDNGTASNGVLPLRRVRGGYNVITTKKVRTQEKIQEVWSGKEASGLISAPYFAEFLVPGSDEGSLPEDVKVSTFYGEISHVHVRRVTRHIAGKTRAVSKFFTEDGDELVGIRPDLETDSSLPLPGHFAELVSAARVLSVASRLPYVRVDLYASPEGVYFGEYTQLPGGGARYVAEHDELMGRMWEEALLRVEVDVTNGVPLRHDYPGTA